MNQFREVNLLGRESVKSINASSLASIIRNLVRSNERNQQTNRYWINCKEKLEIVPKRYRKFGEDEGFESEDDNQSIISNEDTQSTSSSCCFVDDHVFKVSTPDLLKTDGVLSSIGSTDSANSSGSSDTDEVDLSSSSSSPFQQLHRTVSEEYYTKPDTKDLRRTSSNELDYKKTKNFRAPKKESYDIGNVIFCHTDVRHPNIIAWVVKKPNVDPDVEYSRLGKKGIENVNENCLEVLVTKCKSFESLNFLCQNYKEFSKRIKLDQYKGNYRKNAEEKKSITLSAITETSEHKVSLSDIKPASSSLIKSSELSILNPKIMTNFKSSSLLNKTLHKENEPKLTPSVSLNSLLYDKKPETLSQKYLNSKKISESKSVSQSLSNLSGRHVKDVSLIQKTDDGVTHIEITNDKDSVSERKSGDSKSKIRKEIEGVILTDVDSYVRKEPVRQRLSPIVVNGSAEVLKWSDENESPPIRPERKKFVRKNKAPPPPETKPIDPKSKSKFYLNMEDDKKFMKGQFVRADYNPFLSQTEPPPNLGNWKNTDRSRSKELGNSKKRSKSVDRFKILQKKQPMAYRYIDITDSKTESGKFFGLQQKLREISGATGSNQRRRRNSFDDVTAVNNNNNNNLKSVIKKNKKITNCEPKKVTFSAFATVQVVD